MKLTHPHLSPPLFMQKTTKKQSSEMYNPTEDSNRLKIQPELFETLRGDYPLRREEKSIHY